MWLSKQKIWNSEHHGIHQNIAFVSKVRNILKIITIVSVSKLPQVEIGLVELLHGVVKTWWPPMTRTRLFFSDSVFLWYMWLIYGISGCFGGSVVIYLTYKFIAAKIMHHLFPSNQAPHNTLTHPKLSFPKRKIFSTNQNCVKLNASDSVTLK